MERWLRWISAICHGLATEAEEYNQFYSMVCQLRSIQVAFRFSCRSRLSLRSSASATEPEEKIAKLSNYPFETEGLTDTHLALDKIRT